jgi:hypothetical protein
MTVVVAWKRSLKKNVEELCFASDSRLSGGGTISCAQKVFALKRGDVALAFAGDTAIAYPYILQVINSINSYRETNTRGADIIKIRFHVIKMLNQIVKGMDRSFIADDIPDVQIILGGYSWLEKKFHLWKIRYKKDLKRFHYDTALSFGGVEECITYAGDRGDGKSSKEGEINFKTFFKKKMSEKYGAELINKKLDMEPLLYLMEFLEENSSQWSTISFPPQLVKVYQHMNALYIPLVDEHNNIYYCGRKLSDYEHIDEWPLSLKTFERIEPISIKWKMNKDDYSGAAEPPVRRSESH